jgi:hypothetical protein
MIGTAMCLGKDRSVKSKYPEKDRLTIFLFTISLNLS